MEASVRSASDEQRSLTRFLSQTMKGVCASVCVSVCVSECFSECGCVYVCVPDSVCLCGSMCVPVCVGEVYSLYNWVFGLSSCPFKSDGGFVNCGPVKLAITSLFLKAKILSFFPRLAWWLLADYCGRPHIP